MRAILLAVSSIASHKSFTSPNGKPQADERSKYEEQKVSHVGEKGFTAVHAASSMKTITHVVNTIDLLTVLSAVGVPVAHKIQHWLPVDVDPLSIPPAFAVGTVLMALGALIRVLAYNHLGRYFTFHLAIRKDHKLVTSGPYSIVRHPSYTGAWLYMIGVAVSQLGPGSLYSELGLWRNPLGFVAGVCQLVFVAYIGLTIFLRVRKEDAALREEFKDEWLAWASRTPYRLIPGIY